MISFGKTMISLNLSKEELVLTYALIIYCEDRPNLLRGMTHRLQEWKCFNVSNPTLVDISPCERLEFVVVDFPKTIHNK